MLPVTVRPWPPPGVPYSASAAPGYSARFHSRSIAHAAAADDAVDADASAAAAANSSAFVSTFPAVSRVVAAPNMAANVLASPPCSCFGGGMFRCCRCCAASSAASSGHVSGSQADQSLASCAAHADSAEAQATGHGIGGGGGGGARHATVFAPTAR